LLFKPGASARGYNYNVRSGSKFALLNAEMRFPLFRYLIFGALPLAFQNIQGVLFTDIGTVWSNNKDLQFFHENNGSIATKTCSLAWEWVQEYFLIFHSSLMWHGAMICKAFQCLSIIYQ
jgi:outer membrane protein assembly factor BamA